jgi:hypothetical protein
LVETIKAFPSEKDALLAWKLATESCLGMVKVVSFPCFFLPASTQMTQHPQKSWLQANMLLDACWMPAVATLLYMWNIVCQCKSIHNDLNL